MLRITMLALFSFCAFAQNAEELFNRPPAAVDKELRARITEFYEAHMKGEFRKAELLVAEDTKEYFYINNKPRYTSFEIRKIDYFDNFTRAKAMVLCGEYLLIPGFTDKPLDVPIPSTWKLENGKWMWYVSEDARRASPMGRLTGGPATPGAAPPPAVIPDSPDFLYDLVKVDKREVELKAGQSVQVTISNGAPGVMNVSLHGTVSGVEASLDNQTLQGGGKALLTLKAGETPRSGSLEIEVEPIGQMIGIHVTVK